MDINGTKFMVKVVRSVLFPAMLQLAALAFLALLIFMGWHHHGIRGVDIPDPLVYTNAATLFFWVIWLMGIVCLAPLTGRLWCTVCPLGYLNDILARIGLKRRFPNFLRTLFPAALLLIMYNGLVAAFKLNHYPDYTARLMLAMILTAAAAGLIFRGRIFCAYLCPVGAMLGVYSRVSPWRVQARDHSVCRSCQSKDCFRGSTTWYRLRSPLARLTFPFRRPGCQVGLFAADMNDDPRCVMCSQCLKNCPYDNISWGTRPFLGGLRNPVAAVRSEAVFIVFLLGSSLGIFTRVWPGLNRFMTYPGRFLAGFIGLPAPAMSFIKPLLELGLVPLAAIWSVAAAAYAFGLARFEIMAKAPADGRTAFIWMRRRPRGETAPERNSAGRQATLSGIFNILCLALIPVALSAHVSFAMVKLNEKLAYVGGALRDPTGIAFYLGIHKFGFMAAPGEVLPLAFIKWAALLIIAAGTAASLVSARRLTEGICPKESGFRARSGMVMAAAVLSIGGLFAALVIKWLF